MESAAVEKMSKKDRHRAGTLRIATVFYEFVENELLPEIGIKSDDFWQGLESIVTDLTPTNRAVLERRDELQAQIDAWQLARKGQPWSHDDYVAWSSPQPGAAHMDLGPCVAAMQDMLPADSIICNGAGNFSGWWHRYWKYGDFPSQLAPTSGAMGYGVPAAVAAALRFRNRMVVALAGDGDFMMNGQELATAVQYDADLLVLVIDNGSFGTIRLHQEREYPARLSGTDLKNPDFAALASAYGGWSATVESTEDFAPAVRYSTSVLRCSKRKPF